MSFLLPRTARTSSTMAQMCSRKSTSLPMGPIIQSKGNDHQRHGIDDEQHQRRRQPTGALLAQQPAQQIHRHNDQRDDQTRIGERPFDIPGTVHKAVLYAHPHEYQIVRYGSGEQEIRVRVQNRHDQIDHRENDDQQQTVTSVGHLPQQVLPGVLVHRGVIFCHKLPSPCCCVPCHNIRYSGEMQP